MPSVRGIVRERAAQGTVEYALTVARPARPDFGYGGVMESG